MKNVFYIIIITLLLFAFALLMSQCSKKNKDDINSSSESSSRVEDSSDLSSGGDNMVVDNEWAYFLVNDDNPLPEDYKIDSEYIGKNFKGWFYLEVTAAKHYNEMVEAARADGVEFFIASAYRSVEQQQKLIDEQIDRNIENGMSKDEALKEAMRGLAKPGHSEHNTGLAIDIASPEWYETHNQLNETFENTEQAKWLRENAYKYGFILRYPEDKEDITGIIYEPWHYRFVGKYYAQKITESGLCLEEFMANQK